MKRVSKFLKHACIILLFLFKEEKRKRSHIRNIYDYLWQKENCLNELENINDSEIIVCHIDELKGDNLNLLFKYTFFM